jgi:hypothetical protein
VDIDVDSDNTAALGWYGIDRTDWEEQIENEAGYPGKWVWFNGNDDNRNSIEDYLENAAYEYPGGGSWVPFTDPDLVPVVLDRGFEDLSDMEGYVFELKVTLDRGLSYWLDPHKTPITANQYQTITEAGKQKGIYRWIVSEAAASYPPLIYVEGVDGDALTDTLIWRLLNRSGETNEQIYEDTAKLTDPNLPIVTVRASNPFVTEGQTGMSFKVSLMDHKGAPHATQTDITVHYSVDGSATAGDDYAQLPGTVVVPAGSSSVEIPINVVDDMTKEGAEAIQIVLEEAAGYMTNKAIAPYWDNMYITHNDGAIEIGGVAVFAKQPVIGKRIPFTLSPFTTGHAFWQIWITKPLIARSIPGMTPYMVFWIDAERFRTTGRWGWCTTADSTTMLGDLSANYPGFLRRDHSAPYDVSMGLPLTDVDVDKGKLLRVIDETLTLWGPNAWKATVDPKGYNLYGNNCADKAITIANEAGMYILSEGAPVGEGKYLRSPGDLGEDIRIVNH